MTKERNDAPTPHSRCPNCGAKLSGRYCTQCGQDSHVTLTVRHFFEEFVEGITHFDSTFWRTFRPLLLKPGLLTKEFLDGKRKFYAPPLRTYLVLSVLYFLLASFMTTVHINFTWENGKQIEAADCAQLPSRMKLLHWLAPQAEAACQRMTSDHGHALSNAVYGMMPKVMFVVLPFVALVQFWFYRRQRSLYVENLVFVLHFQSFYYFANSLALVLAALIGLIFGVTTESVNSGFDLIILIGCGAYLYLADRRVYGCGKFKTIMSIVALTIAYSFAWVLAFAVTATYLFFRV